MQEHNTEEVEVESKEEAQARKLAKALLKEIDFIPSEVKKLIHEDMFFGDREYDTGAEIPSDAETLTYQLDHLEEDLTDALIAFFEQFSEQLSGDIKDSIDNFIKGPQRRANLTEWKEARPVLVDHSLQAKPSPYPRIIIKPAAKE